MKGCSFSPATDTSKNSRTYADKTNYNRIQSMLRSDIYLLVVEQTRTQPQLHIIDEQTDSQADSQTLGL